MQFADPSKAFKCLACQLTFTEPLDFIDHLESREHKSAIFRASKSDDPEADKSSLQADANG